MAKEIDQQLDDILNIESDIKEKTQVVKLPERSENIETDYRYARENLRSSREVKMQSKHITTIKRNGTLAFTRINSIN